MLTMVSVYIVLGVFGYIGFDKYKEKKAKKVKELEQMKPIHPKVNIELTEKDLQALEEIKAIQNSIEPDFFYKGTRKQGFLSNVKPVEMQVD